MPNPTDEEFLAGYPTKFEAMTKGLELFNQSDDGPGWYYTGERLDPSDYDYEDPSTEMFVIERGLDEQRYFVLTLHNGLWNASEDTWNFTYRKLEPGDIAGTRIDEDSLRRLLGE